MKDLKINSLALLKAAPLAALTSAIINVILFFVGSAAGIMDSSVGMPKPDGGVEPITVLPVVVSSIIPVILAAGVLALLNRFSANPLRIFGILSLVLVVLSFSNPFLAFPNLPLGMGIWLGLMHVVVAGSVWYFFSRYTKKR
ncbi:MAG: DUF6069 family protein [Saprospiraceae bacterium]